MAIYYITRSFKRRISGVFFDPTTVKLSDPTGAYGVRRVDTEEVIVADGTAMTRTELGKYTYPVTTVDGVAYQAYLEAVIDGQTIYQEIPFTGLAATEAATALTAAEMAAAAGEPREATADGVTVRAHPLPDVVAMDKHLATKEAGEDPRGAIFKTKIVPPGVT